MTNNTDNTQDATELLRSNFPTDPRASPCFEVPNFMHDPQVYSMYGHQIRIWRTHLIPLTEDTVRRICALLEWTNLETGLTLGLHWSYSVHQKKEWRGIKYILYSHFPGEQPCKDLADVYRSTTAEIKWVIKRLQRKYEKTKGNKNEYCDMDYATHCTMCSLRR